MGPHYPTGAELAQFRATLRRSLLFTWMGSDAFTSDRALPFELREGIGWSAGAEWPLLDGRPAWQDARALAGAMRSRARSAGTGADTWR